jgi:hypothetical protein
METRTDLDDLKSAWHALERRLERQHALELAALLDRRRGWVRRGLRPLAWGQALQILVGIAGALAFAPFWLAHRGEPALLVSGLVLHAYCLGLVAFGIVMEARIGTIDLAAPVLAIQRQLLVLRRTYVTGGLLVGLPWWFLAAPLLVVLTGGRVMVDAPSAVWLQLLVGGAGLLATLALYRWANRPAHAHWGRWLADRAAGRGIRRAQAALADLEAFERD